jgi:hypothetical protein
MRRLHRSLRRVVDPGGAVAFRCPRPLYFLRLLNTRQLRAVEVGKPVSRFRQGVAGELFV